MAAPGWTAEDVLLQASLSARWNNADAIDTAVTAAVEVRPPPPVRGSAAAQAWRRSSSRGRRSLGD